MTSTVMTWLAVALGGALGASARHGLNELVQRRWGPTYPVGVLVVNALGCFVIGLLAGAASQGRLPLSPAMRVFAFAGVLGGFTTFSSFGLDTFLLARGGAAGAAAVNVMAQVGLGLLAVWAGFTVAGGR